MKRNLFSVPLLTIILVSASAFVKISSGGIVGFSGAPGEATCSNCHGGGGGVTTVSVSASPAFTSNQYMPGQTYTINITVSNSSFSNYGFDCSILTPANANAGTMTTALAGVFFANSGARKNATHTNAKSGTGSATFQFVWVAPGSGTVKIYAAGNAVNNNGSTSGDTPGNTIVTLTANTTGIGEQVSNAANFNVYPNPSHGNLRLQYTLVNEGIVKATLYNLRGQEIYVAFNENQLVGVHNTGIDIPADVEAGVYMLKLSVNGEHYTQRMIIRQ